MLKKLLLLVTTFLLSSSIYSQEIGNVKNGDYSVTLLKSKDRYACVYNDVNTNLLFPKKVFLFPNKETIYTIISEGFKNENNHQIFVKTTENSIVKFEYKKIGGLIRVKIIHNNLYNNSIGNTSFLTKIQVDKLFGKNNLAKI